MRCGGEDRFIHASHAIEHPSRNLKPASGIGAAPRAAEHNIIGLVDRLMDKNRQAEPWMPPIQKLAKAGPVGVIKLRCIMAAVHIRVLTAPHRIKPTSTRCHSAWRPKPGRGSTYRRGDFVQTSETSSKPIPKSLLKINALGFWDRFAIMPRLDLIHELHL